MYTYHITTGTTYMCLLPVHSTFTMYRYYVHIPHNNRLLEHPLQFYIH